MGTASEYCCSLVHKMLMAIFPLCGLTLLSTWNGICGPLVAFWLVCMSPNAPSAWLSNTYLLLWVFLSSLSYLGFSFVLSNIQLAAVFKANLKTSVLKWDGLTHFLVFLITQVLSSFGVVSVSVSFSHLLCEVCFIYFYCSKVVLNDPLIALNLLLGFLQIAYETIL